MPCSVFWYIFTVVASCELWLEKLYESSMKTSSENFRKKSFAIFRRLSKEFSFHWTTHYNYNKSKIKEKHCWKLWWKLWTLAESSKSLLEALEASWSFLMALEACCRLRKPWKLTESFESLLNALKTCWKLWKLTENSDSIVEISETSWKLHKCSFTLFKNFSFSFKKTILLDSSIYLIRINLSSSSCILWTNPLFTLTNRHNRPLSHLLQNSPRLHQLSRNCMLVRNKHFYLHKKYFHFLYFLTPKSFHYIAEKEPTKKLLITTLFILLLLFFESYLTHEILIPLITHKIITCEAKLKWSCAGDEKSLAVCECASRNKCTVETLWCATLTWVRLKN